MKKVTLIYTVLLGAFITAFSYAQVYQQSTGRNSPNVSGVRGSVTITNGHKMGRKDDSPACKCSSDALDYAVIDRLREDGVNVWEVEETKPAADALQKRINRLVVSTRSIKDVCLKAKYEKWLSFNQLQLDSLQARLVELPTGSAVARKAAKDKADFAEAERCKRLGIVPPLK